MKPRIRIVPLGPRALRRIERQRTQYQPSAARERFDRAGTPHLAEPRIWDRLALYGRSFTTEEDH